MKEIFEIYDRNYNFRHEFSIERHKVRSVYYGTDSASSIGPKIWDTLPNSYKDTTGLKSFQEILKGEFLETVSADYARLIFNLKSSFNNKFPRF